MTIGSHMGAPFNLGTPLTLIDSGVIELVHTALDRTIGNHKLVFTHGSLNWTVAQSPL